MRRLTAALLIVCGLGSGSSWGAPAQVILIRHGEKPEKGHDLSPEGQKRAQALVGYFLKNPDVREFGSPVAIYAQGVGTHKSKRPVETVEPLAKALKLKVIPIDYAKGKEMCTDILKNSKYAGKMVLICWEHQAITDLAKALGVEDAPKFPDAYDRTWIITFPKKGKPTLRDLQQKLPSSKSSK
jgi:broad specificity phosphatase PhoE